jgi:Phasin protein
MDKAEKVMAAQAELAAELMQLAMKNGKAMMDVQLEFAQGMAEHAMRSASEALTLKDPQAATAWRMQQMEAQAKLMAGYSQRLQGAFAEANGATMTLMTRHMSKAGGNAMADLQAAMAAMAKPQDMWKQMQDMAQAPMAAMQEAVKAATPKGKR